ncbi:MAG: SpoIID/LytB domain-containing protein [Spirochaetaceae bacterium]
MTLATLLLLPLSPELEAEERRAIATEAWYAGELSAAATILEELLTQDPSRRDVRLDLLVVLRELGELHRAAEVAEGLENEAERTLSLILAGRYEEVDLTARAQAGSEADPAGELLLLRGVGAMRSGRDTSAVELLEEATLREPHLPHGHLYLGQLFLRNQRFEEARASLEEALRQDSNLTEALPALAEATYATGRTETAYRLLRRAEVALPWNERLPALRRSWELAHPELLAGSEAEEIERRRVATPPTVASEVTTAPVNLRVGLSEGLTSIYLKSGGNFRLYTVPGDLGSQDREERQKSLAAATDTGPSYEGSPAAVVRVVVDGEQLVVESEGGEELLRAGEAVRLRQGEAEQTTTLFDLTYGAGQFYGGRTDRSYRGELEFILRGDGTFTVVNELPLEEYLYSVIPSEMPASWPMEALRAQAVAARSYTLHDRRRFRQRGFDLLSSVTSAHYSGVTGEHPRSSEAVRSTRGVVLQDGRGTLDAVYSANSAGYTESSESVWGFPTSLVAVADPLLPPVEPLRAPGNVHRWVASRPESYSGADPYASAAAYRWRRVVSREELELRLRNRGIEVGTLTGMRPGRRGSSGRLETVRILGTRGEAVVRRDAIRGALGGLRSNLFVFAPVINASGDLEAFAFHGAGWGHGVGLCQTGAAGMAAAGYSAEEILAHYYPENDLLTLEP